VTSLRFGKGNAKLGPHVYTFSLPAGWTCPGARDCLARVDRQTGTLTDGPHTVFRCFSASQEATFPSARRARWANFDALTTAKTTPAMTALLLASLPPAATMVRVHVSGDFFNQAYFDAWRAVAIARPAVVFYAYTKSVPFWAKRTLPSNFRLTASLGGKHDAMAIARNHRVVSVVFNAADTVAPIDHDDSHAQAPTGGRFALLLHGTQPKGSRAARALAALKADGFTGYGTGRE
jgi:hypothetical protein